MCRTTRWFKKVSHIVVFFITPSYTYWFSKILSPVHSAVICMLQQSNDPTTPQTLRHATLWNTNVSSWILAVTQVFHTKLRRLVAYIFAAPCRFVVGTCIHALFWVTKCSARNMHRQWMHGRPQEGRYREKKTQKRGSRQNWRISIE